MIMPLSSARVSEINDNIKKMGNLTNMQLKKCILALKNNDKNEARKIILKDDIVDNLHKEIEEECIKYIATEQPLAKDLRRVFTASKIVTDLERMADYIVNICKIMLKDDFNVKEEDLKGIIMMEEKLCKMIELVIEAYVNRDEKEAYRICKLDDEIDKHHSENFEYIVKFIKMDEKNAILVANLMFISKYLERLGDHITNICEWIIFSKTGEYLDLNE